MVAETGKLPVVNFSAGGIATPADAALMMQLGVDGVFVGSGIFKSQDPATMARAIVEATTHFQDPDVLAKVSRGIGDPMAGLEIGTLGDAPAGPRLVAGGPPVKAGVLALQGDFREHASVLGRGRRPPVEVRTPETWPTVRLPGDPRRRVDDDRQARPRLRPGRPVPRSRAPQGMPILGTCAGHDRAGRRGDWRRPLFALMDITVQRNAYGRQVDSFEADIEVDGVDHPVRGVFIRAPRIEEVGRTSGPGDASRSAPSSWSKGTWSWHPSTRSSSGETGLHEYLLRKV